VKTSARGLQENQEKLILKNKYPRVARREFLTTTAAAGGTMLLGPVRLKAAGDGIDPRVAQVMAKTIGIDMHNHVYPAGTEPHPDSQARPGEQQATPELSIAEELKQSGLTAVCASFVLDFAQNTRSLSRISD
jgi:membrane dipeptidase